MDLGNDLLWPHFSPLWEALRTRDSRVLLVAGGYGLYLKQHYFLASRELPTLVSLNQWLDTTPRVTKDMDLVIDLELIADEEQNRQTCQILRDHGFTESDQQSGLRWQWMKPLDEDRQVVVELHAPRPSVEDKELVSDGWRVKRKQSLKKDGIHGHDTPEAVGCETNPFALDINGVPVEVPNPITWTIMKLTAMRDRWIAHEEATEEEKRRRFRDDAIKHGRDVCRVVALMTELGFDNPIPDDYRWSELAKKSGDELELHYRHTLENLGTEPGLVGIIFRKAQNKIANPSDLQRVIKMIADEDWSGMDVDIKGAIYEGLLEKTASSSDKGAGQYFTPRPLIRAIVEVMQPKPGQLIGDPACGTGGFLLAAHDWIQTHHDLDKAARRHLKTEALHGNDIVPGVVRLCAMNLYLHGIGGSGGVSPPSSAKDLRRDAAATWMTPITEGDALAQSSGRKFDLILANPPFGKKGGYTIVGDDGRITTEKQEYERDEFWATTANKQLNFLQHIVSELKIGGSAAVVLPDNVLFEGGAGETIRRELLKRCNVHTLLRLPTGIFYAQGVKANVLFFDRKEASEEPWTKELWIYDLRTNQHFTLKTNPLKESDLTDFVDCYLGRDARPARPGGEKSAKGKKADERAARPYPAARTETERFRKFTYDEIVARDKANLDIFWLKDESLEDTENLPPPAELAAEIVESLEIALEEFRGVEEALTTGAEAN